MRKNSQRFIMFVIGVALALCINVFVAPRVKDSLKNSLDFSKGTQLVYTADSEDARTVQQTAEVLRKRIAAFGATDTDMAVTEAGIAIQFTGVEDVETLRKNLTKAGTLTMRNSDDELIMDASVLDPEMPVTVLKNGEDVVVVLNVKDTDTFYEKTATQAAATNKMMVIWVDFDEATDSYAAESSSNNPKYLAAATVSSGINGSCYINTQHTYEDALAQVVTAQSGALPAAVTEVALNEIDSKFGNGSIISLAGLVILMGVLIYRYGIAGITTSLMLRLNAVGYFNFTAKLGVPYNTLTVACFFISVIIGLMIIKPELKEFKTNLLRGRNLQSAVDSGLAVNERTAWEIAVAQIALGGLGYLFFRNTVGNFAGCVLIGGLCNLVLYVLWNRLMLKDLVYSGYFTDLKMYCVKPEQLPDVEKGESYKEEPSKFNFDFAALLKGNLGYIVYGLSFAAIILAVNSADKAVLLKTLCVAAIFALVATLYVSVAYKQRYALMPVFIMFDAFVALLLTVIGSNVKFAGIILAAVALSVAVLFCIIGKYREGFKSLAREKINEDKLNKLVNSVLNGFAEDYCVTAMEIAAVALLAVLIGVRNIWVFVSVTLLAVSALVTGALIASKYWYSEATKYIDRKPRKSTKKKGNKERSETTIFGLNEVK